MNETWVIISGSFFLTVQSAAMADVLHQTRFLARKKGRSSHMMNLSTVLSMKSYVRFEQEWKDKEVNNKKNNGYFFKTWFYYCWHNNYWLVLIFSLSIWCFYSLKFFSLIIVLPFYAIFIHLYTVFL